MTPGELTTFFDRDRKNRAGVVAKAGVKLD
jgi:hypothetical protein